MDRPRGGPSLQGKPGRGAEPKGEGWGAGPKEGWGAGPKEGWGAGPKEGWGAGPKEGWGAAQRRRRRWTAALSSKPDRRKPGRRGAPAAARPLESPVQNPVQLMLGSSSRSYSGGFRLFRTVGM